MQIISTLFVYFSLPTSLLALPCPHQPARLPCPHQPAYPAHISLPAYPAHISPLTLPTSACPLTLPTLPCPHQPARLPCPLYPAHISLLYTYLTLPIRAVIHPAHLILYSGHLPHFILPTNKYNIKEVCIYQNK